VAADLANYSERAKEAVQIFWQTREAAKLKQRESGTVDQGERSGVTSGKNMDGFVTLAKNIVHANGLANAEIMLKGSILTLPGYFRPTKLWDMLVLDEGQLVAALEFKSQVGPSFGNNFNNRTEEAIGTAHDIWTAYRDDAFGEEAPKPFVGWLMLIEDTEKSRSPVKNVSPNFDVFAEFEGASYIDRYDILCRKLIQEQLYSSAAVLTSERNSIQTGCYNNVSELTSLKSFAAALAGHIAMVAAKK
jgi:restriction endonuclease XhoI-like protein